MSLQNMPFAKRLEFMEEIAAVIVRVLDERGPLNMEALTLFTQRAWRETAGLGWLSSGDLRATIVSASTSSSSRDNNLDKIGYNSNTFLYFLRGAEEVEKEKLPAPRDYVEAFYNLYDRYDALRKNPEMCHLPDNLLDDLFGEIN